MIEKKVPDYYIPINTVLKEKYRITDYLGAGGFGITYKGENIQLEMPVAIKEYFPSGFASRYSPAGLSVTLSGTDKNRFYSNGKEKFLNEAKMLAKCSKYHEIVSVHDFFEENETAYIVMEYVEGMTLKQYVKNIGLFGAEDICRKMIPLLHALNNVHKQGLIHRDISPENIMILSDGTLKLFDFGAARDYSEENKSLSILLKRGYAPEEQYRSRGVQGPFTDVYSVCATLYYCITGVRPDEAPQRVFSDEVKPLTFYVNVSERINSAVMKGLSVHAADRFQNAIELAKALVPDTVKAAPVAAAVKSEALYHGDDGSLPLPAELYDSKRENRETQLLFTSVNDYSKPEDRKTELVASENNKRKFKDRKIKLFSHGNNKHKPKDDKTELVTHEKAHYSNSRPQKSAAKANPHNNNTKRKKSSPQAILFGISAGLAVVGAMFKYNYIYALEWHSIYANTLNDTANVLFAAAVLLAVIALIICIVKGIRNRRNGSKIPPVSERSEASAKAAVSEDPNQKLKRHPVLVILFIMLMVGVKQCVSDAVEKNNKQNNASVKATYTATTTKTTELTAETKYFELTLPPSNKSAATTTRNKTVKTSYFELTLPPSTKSSETTTTPPATTKAKTTTTTAATTTTTAAAATTKANKTKTTNNFKVVNICFSDSKPINGSANKKDEISRNSPVYVIYDLIKDDVDSGTEYIAGSYSWDIIYPNGEVENGYSGGDVIYDGYSYQSYFIQLTEDSGYGGKGTIKIIFYDNSGNTLASGSVKLV